MVRVSVFQANRDKLMTSICGVGGGDTENKIFINAYNVHVLMRLDVCARKKQRWFSLYDRTMSGDDDDSKIKKKYSSGIVNQIGRR